MGRRALIVADTHALLWWIGERHQLSPKARQALDADSIGVAVIAFFEIARLAERKRILLERDAESLGRALVRKILGKFDRRFETNMRIAHGGIPVGQIVRRPDAEKRMDLLEVTNDALDRRVAVALAT